MLSDQDILDKYQAIGDRITKAMIKNAKRETIDRKRDIILKCRFFDAVSHGDKDIIDHLGKFWIKYSPSRYRQDYDLEQMKGMIYSLSNGEMDEFIQHLRDNPKWNFQVDKPITVVIDNARDMLAEYKKWRPITYYGEIDDLYHHYGRNCKYFYLYQDLDKNMDTLRKFDEDYDLYKRINDRIEKTDRHILKMLNVQIGESFMEKIKDDHDAAEAYANDIIDKITRSERYIKTLKPNLKGLTFEELEAMYRSANRTFIQTIASRSNISSSIIKEDECSGFSIVVVYDNIDIPFFLYYFFTIDVTLIYNKANDHMMVENAMKTVGKIDMKPICVIISDIHGDVDKVIIANEIRNKIDPSIKIILNGDIPISPSRFGNNIINPKTGNPYTARENNDVVINEIMKVNNCTFIYGNHDSYLIGKQYNGIYFEDASFYFHYIIERPKFVLYISHSFVNDYSKITNWKSSYGLDDYIHDYGTKPNYYFPQSSNLSPSAEKYDFDYKTKAIDYIEKEVSSAHDNKPVYLVFGHSFQFLYLDQLLKQYPSSGNHIYYLEETTPREMLKKNKPSGKYQASDSLESGRHSLYGGSIGLCMSMILVVLILIVVVVYCSSHIRRNRKLMDFEQYDSCK